MVACWQQGPNLQCFVQKLQVEWLKVLFCYRSRFISLYMLPSTDRLHLEQAQYVVPLKGYPRMGEAAEIWPGNLVSLSLLTCSWGPANCTCFFSSPTSPQSPWARLWNGVLALSATEIMQKVCVGIGAAPLASTYDVKAVRGGWCLVPDFMFLCSWELPVLPSAALLQSCYSKGHSIDPPRGSCEGRWSARQCIGVQNLDSCTLCQAALEAYSVVWLSAWVRIGSSEMCQAFSQRGLQQGFCLRIVCRNLVGPWSCSEPPDC